MIHTNTHLCHGCRPAEIVPEPETEAALTGVASSTPDVHTDGSATATPTSVEGSDSGNSGSGGSSSNMAAIIGMCCNRLCALRLAHVRRWVYGCTVPPQCRASPAQLLRLLSCAGGAVGGAVGALLLVALGWWCVRRRQAARDAQGTSTMHAMHLPAGEAQTCRAAVQLHRQLTSAIWCCRHAVPCGSLLCGSVLLGAGLDPSTEYNVVAPCCFPCAAGVTANISLASLSLKDRFELTEVVEQTGDGSQSQRAHFLQLRPAVQAEGGSNSCLCCFKLGKLSNSLFWFDRALYSMPFLPNNHLERWLAVMAVGDCSSCFCWSMTSQLITHLVCCAVPSMQAAPPALAGACGPPSQPALARAPVSLEAACEGGYPLAASANARTYTLVPLAVSCQNKPLAACFPSTCAGLTCGAGWTAARC